MASSSSRLKRRMVLRRKLRMLRTLTKSQSVKKSSIIMDAFLYIYQLKLQLQAIKDEYLHILNHIPKVEVEEIGKGFVVRVICKTEGEDDDAMMVSILKAFEEMGLDVVHARVSVRHFISMEAIVQPQDDHATLINATDISHCLQKTIDPTTN